MHIFTSLDEIRTSIGLQLGPTEWLTVEQSRIDEFARATGDFQWIHVDPERAAGGPFGGTIAHGYLTLSLVAQFAEQLWGTNFVETRLNYGMQKVRFPTPVPVGSRLRASAAIQEVNEVPAGHQVIVRYTIELEDSPRPACVAETVTLLLGQISSSAAR